MKSKVQMTKFNKKCFAIDSFWNVFGLWILKFEPFITFEDLFRLPARSCFGEGRDLDIRISNI
jgi:hypothetical protein